MNPFVQGGGDPAASMPGAHQFAPQMVDPTGAGMDPVLKDALIRALMGGGVPMDPLAQASAQGMQAVGQPNPYAGVEQIPHVPATQ